MLRLCLRRVNTRTRTRAHRETHMHTDTLSTNQTSVQSCSMLCSRPPSTQDTPFELWDDQKGPPSQELLRLENVAENVVTEVEDLLRVRAVNKRQREEWKIVTSLRCPGRNKLASFARAILIRQFHPSLTTKAGRTLSPGQTATHGHRSCLAPPPPPPTYHSPCADHLV